MRRRTLILLILVLLAAAAAAIIIFVVRPSGGIAGGLLPGAEEAPAQATVAPQAEPGEPAPTPTPAVQFSGVVVAIANIPVGSQIRSDLIAVEKRPSTNIGIVAGVTFSDPDALVGQIAKTEISRGQEILRPMIALNPSDISALGSDLSLYVDQGKVAVAFPIDQFSGAAFSVRPGDLVDAFMSLTLVDVDQEFQTDLPNVAQRVDETALSDGRAFLFPPTAEGRLELIPGLNIVAQITPGEGKDPIPRRVTQLAMQQMEVLWVGTWRDPDISMQQEWLGGVANLTDPAELVERGASPEAIYNLPARLRPERRPDVIILSLTSQDALALKWALETGISIDLVLRSQGDNTQFVTTSVSLPQVFADGVIVPPELTEQGLHPRIDQVPVPQVPAIPPG
jgi:Flp pilus assembly protein CpaB